jgi:hypothetical protein
MTRQLPAHGPLGRKVVRALQKQLRARVVDLRAFAAAKQTSQQLVDSLGGDERFRGLEPAHAVYVFMQHRVSLLLEVLSQLPALDPLTQVVHQAEEEYMPGGPPMSPLTLSYFVMWSYFDAAVGDPPETLGTCLLDAGDLLEVNPEFLRLLQQMQDSRMGLYVHVETRGALQVLRELVTGEQRSYLVPAGYIGRPGEVWLARALPPPSPAFAEGVVFTTPYVIRGYGERAWRAFLKRTLARIQAPDEPSAYAALMKWGLSPFYWHEFIFQAYAGHELEVVYLTGLPDVRASRPHGQEPPAEPPAAARPVKLR